MNIKCYIFIYLSGNIKQISSLYFQSYFRFGLAGVLPAARFLFLQ